MIKFPGFGPLPWAIMGEIFPANLKSVASALTASFCWSLGFLLTKSFTTVSEAIGIYSVFWAFAVCCVFALLFSIYLLPQTEGKSLQEIQDMLHGRTKSEGHKMMTRTPWTRTGSHKAQPIRTKATDLLYYYFFFYFSFLIKIYTIIISTYPKTNQAIQ